MRLLLLTLLAPYVLWIMYLACMNLLRARDKGTLTPIVRYLGLPVYYFGMGMNITLNFTLFSLLVLDLPRELLISNHLGRLLTESSTPVWKRAICTWICANLLDPFDPTGQHCTCKQDKDKLL